MTAGRCGKGEAYEGSEAIDDTVGSSSSVLMVWCTLRTRQKPASACDSNVRVAQLVEQRNEKFRVSVVRVP